MSLQTENYVEPYLTKIIFKISLIFHKFITKGMSSQLEDYILPHQTRVITVDLSFEAILKKCVEALDKLNTKATNINKETGTIIAKTKMSWKSIGEEIRISLVKEEDEKVNVTVSSVPSLRTTLLDYGKGYQNVTSIVSHISS